MSQYIYLGTQNLSNRVYGGFKFSGGIWSVKQVGATSLETANRRDEPKGGSVSFSVVFDSEADASVFLKYCWENGPDNPDFDEENGVDLAFYLRSNSWYFRVWGISAQQTKLNSESMDYIQYAYEVTCYFYSPYSYAATTDSWTATSQALPETSSALSNADGYMPCPLEVLEITCAYNAGHVSDLVHTIADCAVALTICDDALTNEIWTLCGNENKLTEVYEDPITSGTQWGNDTTGDGTFDTDHIELDDGESAYYKLSGPNPVKKPIVMTADLSLDSGGADGLAYVQISPDGVSWQTVLDQDDFESGATEYILNGSKYMTDVYVRFICGSGTAGKYLNIGSIKFEVERWIEDGGVPTIPAGGSKTATLSGTGTVTIDGEFRPRRKFV